MSRIRQISKLNHIEPYEVDFGNSDFTNWSGDNRDPFRSPFSPSITNSTTDNPKQLVVAFRHTVKSLQVGLGENNGGDFSNVKLSLLGSGGTVRSLFDQSADNTKLTSLNMEFGNELFNSILIEFYTADPVSISNITIQKAEYVTTQIQGKKDDGDFGLVSLTNRGNTKVSIQEYGDTQAIDAFSRLRVSEPGNIYENFFNYDLNPLDYDNDTAGTGAVNFLSNESAAELTTGGTGSGARATLQTRKYHRYQPGKSQLILMTGTLGAPKAGVRQRIGYFDDNDGLFFEQDENGVYVVIRSSTSGSPVDTRIPQASWNVDTLDGTGFSAYNLDLSLGQIFVIDFQWLGMGRVRFGFDINGLIVYCHASVHANVLNTIYMRTPHLPLRTEIENTAAAASATTLKQFCSAIVSEGGVPESPGRPFAVGRGTSSLAVTTRRPVLSLRSTPTFNGLVNRGHIVFSSLEVLASTNSSLWELVYNGTLTGATWNNVDASHSIADYDTAATTITGGIVVAQGWAIAGLGAAAGAPTEGAVPIELFNNFTGLSPDRLSIVCTSFSGTSNVNANLQWTEQR